MRLPQPQHRPQEENMIPLINIVFLLLIFFMLAGTLAAPDLFRVEPPQSSATAVPGEEAVVLMLAEDGRLALEQEYVRDSALAERVRQQLEARPQAELQVKADASVSSRRLLEIMNLLRDAGVDKIRLLTVRGG